MPVALKDPKQVSADSLQSPHDPDVTYSGHKGKGYEVQVAETCHEENATQLITHVEVTPSSGSDTDVSVPVVDGLAERKVRPDELYADTAYRVQKDIVRNGLPVRGFVAQAGWVPRKPAQS